MIICVGSMRVYSGYKPFNDAMADLFAEVAQWQLFFTMFAALAIRVGLDDQSLEDQVYFDNLLMILQFFAPVMLLWFFIQKGGLQLLAKKLQKARKQFLKAKAEAEVIEHELEMKLRHGDFKRDPSKPVGNFSAADKDVDVEGTALSVVPGNRGGVTLGSSESDNNFRKSFEAANEVADETKKFRGDVTNLFWRTEFEKQQAENKALQGEIQKLKLVKQEGGEAARKKDFEERR